MRANGKKRGSQKRCSKHPLPQIRKAEASSVGTLDWSQFRQTGGYSFITNGEISGARSVSCRFIFFVFGRGSIFFRLVRSQAHRGRLPLLTWRRTEHTMCNE